MECILRKLSLVILGVLTIILSIAPTASADKESRPLPREVVTVLDRLSLTGELSDADRAVLRKHPEIAAQVLDPAKITATSKTTTVAGSNAFQSATGVAARHCHISEGQISGHSVLGSTVYVWHHRADWCADNVTVQSFHYRQGWATELASTMYFRGVTANWNSPTPSGYAESFMQAHIENCIFKYGCINSNYPWVKIKTWANGHWYDEVGH
ncbi:hypothetical protein Aglo01_31280 [Actinokineospora globicatena]|nr:hypothetical protein Aglo01_31280 [Actinokineospora globicatena]GLW84686.1 hypothetical protein Aglo02_23260 [Actinokineospora globicatena]